MPKLKLTNEEAEAIFYGDHEDAKTIKKCEWIDEGKYSYGEMVFKYKDGKFYRLDATRSGSYFTDYETYFEAEAVEVEEKEVTVKKWIPVDE
jgi:hypothetical protein